MNDAFLSSLGICMKAKKLSYGFETVKESLIQGKAELVFLAKDLSDKSKKEVLYLTEQIKIPAIKTNYTKDELGKAIGKMTGIISVNDAGFARMLEKKLSN